LRLRSLVGLTNRLDVLMGTLLPYLVMLIVGIFILYVYYMGSSLTLNLVMEFIGIIAGAVSVYYIYQSLGQEKNIQFFEGERLLLKSTTPNTYVVVTSLGDKDVPLNPIKSNIYLTNIGIIAEPPGTGEYAVYIPLDMITDYSMKQNGIRIRYHDTYHRFIEAMIFVDDKDAWIRSLSSMLSQRMLSL
jgi:hypothetical protein